jgi:hypothetical protein
MTHIQLVSKVGPDGFLRVPLPQEMKDQELEILLVIQPIQPQVKRQTGGPPGFFEKTYGCLADDQIERAPQGTFEVRESLV